MAQKPRAPRVVSLLLGLVAIGLAFFVPTKPVPDGGRTLEGWIFATLGIWIILRSLGGPRWTLVLQAAWALAIGLFGQLALTNPLWLQYLRIAPGEIKDNVGFLFAIVIQVVLVIALMALAKARMKETLRLPGRRGLRWHHVVLGAVLFVACAAHLTRYVDKPHFAALSYAAQLGLTAVLLVINLLNVALIYATAPVDAVRELRDRFARIAWEPKLPWILAAWTFVVTLILGWFALDFVPHIPDELSYIFQAECLARGSFWGQAPATPEAFKVYLVTTEAGRWFAVTSPGWPALLAIGSAIGAPWIVNPLLAALSIPLAHALTRRLVGRKAAHGVALLLSMSPWLLFLSASYMTHTSSLFLMLAAWLCLAKARDAGQRSQAAIPWALLGGALLGWLALVRQLDAVLLVGILGLWMLGLFGKRFPWSAIVASGVGFVAVASLIFPYNAAMTGHASEFPLNAYLDKLWYPGANRLGFGADVGNPPGWGDLDAFPGHGLRDVLVNTNQNLYSTNFELFGWCIGSLFFAAVHLFFGKKTAVDKLMIFAVVVLFLGYHLYWYSGGPDFGARYWYLMIYPLVVLTWRGIETAIEALSRGPAGDNAVNRSGGGPLGPPASAGSFGWSAVFWPAKAGGPAGAVNGIAAGESAAPRMAVVIGVLIVTALTVFIPWRAVARYKDYRGFHADYRHLDLEPNALVFVKSKRNSDYWSAFIRNSPDQTERRPIFAEDVGESVSERLIAAFPDRTVYFVEGRSTGGATRITAVQRPRR